MRGGRGSARYCNLQRKAEGLVVCPIRGEGPSWSKTRRAGASGSATRITHAHVRGHVHEFEAAAAFDGSTARALLRAPTGGGAKQLEASGVREVHLGLSIAHVGQEWAALCYGNVRRAIPVITNRCCCRL